MARFVGIRRLRVLNLLIPFIKAFALCLFYLVSSYVLICGKSRTGIKLDYAFFAIMVWVVMISL